MKKIPEKQPDLSLRPGTKNKPVKSFRRSKIESLKEMINNEEYVNEAISKLANSLTSGLMK